MTDHYEPYFAARTFSAEALAARRLLVRLGVSGDVPLAEARKNIGRPVPANDNEAQKVAA